MNHCEWGNTQSFHGFHQTKSGEGVIKGGLGMSLHKEEGKLCPYPQNPEIPQHKFCKSDP